MNFDSQETDPQESTEESNSNQTTNQMTYRGTKEFIQHMNNSLAHEKYGMFEDPIDPVFEDPEEKEAE